MKPNINWKNAIMLIIIIDIIIIGLMLFVGGCSLFQMSPADKIASLPETPQQQLFQTLAKTNWLFTLSVVGVGAGFFAFLNGSSKGLQFMAACFVVISLIIGITRYSAVIAVISMLGTVCLMVYSVLVKNKAVREIVRGVEDVKLADDTRSSDSTLGLLKLNISNKLAAYQSKTTRAIVKTVKGKL